MITYYLRPLLESWTSVWSPTLLGDCQLIENVQHYFTHRLFHRAGLPQSCYADRLVYLQIYTLQHRRSVNDMVLLFKYVRGFSDSTLPDFINMSNNRRTRGHRYKLCVQYKRSTVFDS